MFCKRTVLFFLVSLLMMIAAGARDLPAQSDRSATLHGLNNELLRLHGEHQNAAAEQQAAVAQEAAAIIQSRAAALVQLMQQDPGEALTLAFSPDLLADLAAAFPQSAASLESQGTWQGTVEHFVQDDASFKTSRSFYTLKSGQQALTLHFSGAEPPLKSGQQIQVSGVRSGDTVAANSSTVTWAYATSGSTSTTTTSGATTACGASGAQNAAVLLVTFPGMSLPAGVTAQSVHDTFFSTTTDSLYGFWQQGSHGQTWPAGNVFGPYQLSTVYTCGQAGGIQKDAIAAATAAGVNLQNYDRLFFVFPDSTCSWSGSSSVGCTTASLPSGSSWPASISYLVAGYMSNYTTGVQLVTHEAGHQLGLMHARSRDFGTEPLGAVGTQGTLGEYGDWFSTMGYWNLGEYSAKHKVEDLGWFPLGGTNFQTVQGSGTYTLQPLENNTSSLQGLKVQRGTGNNAWLWIEYRQPLGPYDSTLLTQPYSGALIHYEDSYTGGRTDLLNFTPSDTSNHQPALAAGQTWTDPYTNLSLAVQSATASGLTVSVMYGGAPCTHANPTVAISPADPTAYAGSSVSYTVAVTNNDASGCAAGTFQLSSSQPSGWTGTFSAASLSLNPGQAGSVTMTEAAPPGAAPGTYAVTATAASGSFTASASANCSVVSASLSASLAASAPSYTRKQKATLTASVSYNGVPASGASVTFTLTKANGSTVTGTATTGANGQTSWSYKFSTKDPAGTYSAAAQSNYNSQMATSNRVSFSVQ